MAIDVGFLWTQQRAMQTAADAASIAAVTAARGGQSTTSAARTASSLNGFTNGQNNVTVTVNNPPASGTYSGNSNYYEVLVTQPVSTFFLTVLGYKTVSVTARAVGGGVTGPACVYALAPSQPAAISLTGNITVNAACGILDDSSSSTALSASGNGSVTATSIGVVGNYTTSGTITLSPTPKTGMAPASDPFAGHASPTVATCTQAATTSSGSYSESGISQTVTVPVGVYAGGISISGINNVVTFTSGTYGNATGSSAAISIGGTGANVTFNPGQYQNGGGTGASISIGGNATTTFNSGLYTFCGPISITGNNTVTLSPGLYAGGISISGNAHITFNPGTYILAGGGFSVTGNSTLTGTGVTFYNTSSTSFAYKGFNLTGNETANFSAPTSGSMEAMLFLQDRSVASGSPGSTIVGNSSSTFDGVLYFPTTAVSYNGNSSVSGYTVIVASTITVTGNSSITLGSNYSSLADGAPIKSSTLYE